MTTTEFQTTYIGSAFRSPFAPPHGALAEVHPVDLLAELLRETRRRVDGDDPFVFCAVNEQVGAQAGNVAAAAMDAAGWAFERPPVTVSGGELSGQAALGAACDAVRSGSTTLALAAGVASTSMVPPGAAMRTRDFGRPWADRSTPWSPSQACEQMAARGGVDREHLKAWTDQLRERQATSDASGWIHPVAGAGMAATVSGDETVSTDGVDEFAMFEDDGVITASSWATAADGAAVIAVTAHRDGAAALVERHEVWNAHPPAASLLDALTEGAAWSTLDSQCAVVDIEVVRSLGLDPASVNLCGSPLLRGRPPGVSNLAAVVDAHRLVTETSSPGVVVCAGVDGTIDALRVKPV
jgi:acetyl-CoA acetyltransferase